MAGNFRSWTPEAGEPPLPFWWLWVKTVLDPILGLVNSPPILEPILVVGLGCSLGVRDFDPWPDGFFRSWNPPPGGWCEGVGRILWLDHVHTDRF